MAGVTITAMNMVDRQNANERERLNAPLRLEKLSGSSSSGDGLGTSLLEGFVLEVSEVGKSASTAKLVAFVVPVVLTLVVVVPAVVPATVVATDVVASLIGDPVARVVDAVSPVAPGVASHSPIRETLTPAE